MHKNTFIIWKKIFKYMTCRNIIFLVKNFKYNAMRSRNDTYFVLIIEYKISSITVQNTMTIVQRNNWNYINQCVLYSINPVFTMTRNVSSTMRISVRQSGSDLTHRRVEYFTDRRTATGNWPLGYQSLRFACLPSWAVNRRKGRKVWSDGVGYPH